MHWNVQRCNNGECNAAYSVEYNSQNLCETRRGTIICWRKKTVPVSRVQQRCAPPDISWKTWKSAGQTKKRKRLQSALLLIYTLVECQESRPRIPLLIVRHPLMWGAQKCMLSSKVSHRVVQFWTGFAWSCRAQIVGSALVPLSLDNPQAGGTVAADINSNPPRSKFK